MLPVSHSKGEKRLEKAIINGTESNYYYIDRVGNLENKDGHKMTHFRSHNGYDRVKLSVGVKRGMYLVHRLVAETYIPNPEGHPIVNHLNSVRHDNRAENLEWTTNSENQLQRFRKNGHKGTKRKPVKQICLDTGKVLKVWGSPIDATRELGIAYQNISKVCRGIRNSAGGYFWEHV